MEHQLLEFAVPFVHLPKMKNNKKNKNLFFPANLAPSSNLKQPPFQSLSRFTGIGFVRTKRIFFLFRGVLTTLNQLQSTRGCGHLSGPGSQGLGTGILQPGQSWQGGKGDSRDTSTFVTSCPIGMSLPADSSCEGRVSLHFTQSGL